MRRLLSFLLLAVIAGASAAVWTAWQLRRPYKGYNDARTFVDAPRGTSRRQIAGMLARDGVIPSPLAFELYSRWHTTSLKAGEYMFDQPLSARDVFWKIASGQVYVQLLTVPEGWTHFDIADALDREGMCRRDDFLAVANDPSLVRDVAPEARSLEGFLFPATYQFPHHVTAQQVAATMVEHFRSEWANLTSASQGTAQTGGLADQQVSKIVAMASLVERETPRPKERPLVASVFYNRLEQGYPLQSDPTVQYAMALAGRPIRIVKAADLTFDSPYNTYRHAGLPPGPIANPGEASLRAALDPAQTNYLYFVANTEGGHFFSSTLEEHNRNVAHYRRLLASQQGAASDDAPQQPDPPARGRRQPQKTPKSHIARHRKTNQHGGGA